MTRSQRRFHRIAWLVLTPIAVAILAVALARAGAGMYSEFGKGSQGASP